MSWICRWRVDDWSLQIDSAFYVVSRQVLEQISIVVFFAQNDARRAAWVRKMLFLRKLMKQRKRERSNEKRDLFVVRRQLDQLANFMKILEDLARWIVDVLTWFDRLRWSYQIDVSKRSTERDIDESVYDASARSLKRLRVALTIDLRLSAKRKSRVDAQRRASFEIALDSKSEMKKKKKKIATKKVVKEEKKKEEKRKKRKNDADDDDEKNDDVDVRIVQIVVNKQFEVQIFVIIDKRSFSRRFVKK